MRTQSSWSCAMERRTNSWGSCAQAAATVMSASKMLRSGLIPDGTSAGSRRGWKPGHTANPLGLPEMPAVVCRQQRHCSAGVSMGGCFERAIGITARLETRAYGKPARPARDAGGVCRQQRHCSAGALDGGMHRAGDRNVRQVQTGSRTESPCRICSEVPRTDR